MIAGLNSQQLLLILLCVVCVCGIAYAIFYKRIANEQRAGDRLSRVSHREKIASERVKASEVSRRKKNIQDVVSELEDNQNEKKAGRRSLKQRLNHAGLNISPTVFYLVSLVAAILGFLIAVIARLDALYLMLFGVVFGLGLPNWILSLLAKRRQKKFIDEFPNAIEVIVRGIKAGLPLTDCLRMVANEANEPLCTEFKGVVEAQQLGEPMDQAINRLYTAIPCAETNFFSIVVSIQSRTGGSLSEALGNLSKVLRERKKMAGKVKAISSEAKASAGIIGALPIAVSGIVYLSNPKYLAPLLETSTGNFLLLVGAGMMVTGILVMRNMINFDI